jgi:thioesterase domain-containing protein
MVELEKTFNVPVIESYGMTEAAHQMASNPLPPGKRKAGSVGTASGPEIAVMDNAGRLLSKNEVGEIVIRGPNVMKGYENNPEANGKAFTNGWFRTGDQGYFDEDDYLVITDRIKEIINRGGEKISPREVDEALLDHPDILRAVVFAVPHPNLGEDVAAAIVLRDNASVTEWEIQQFLADRVVHFKVPRRIVILKEIPKGPTGKMQRVGLAEKLGLTMSVYEEFSLKIEYKAPITPLEKALTHLWSEVLKIKRIGVNDNFFQLGGNSLLAQLILVRISEELQIEKIPLAIFLHAPTIEKMARILSQKDVSVTPASLIKIHGKGSRQPIYCVHACSGEVLFLTDLARHLGPEQPFYALRAQGLDENTVPYARVEDMAAHYVREIQAVQPEGPYFLGGAGVGGMIALEMAQQLISQNKKVALLILMDTVVPRSGTGFSFLRRFLRRPASYVKQRGLLMPIRMFLLSRYRRIPVSIPPKHRDWVVDSLVQRAYHGYNPKQYMGHILLFTSQKRSGFPSDPKARIDPWRRVAAGPFDAYVIPGEHLDMFRNPNVQLLVQQLRRQLVRVQATED